MPLSEARHIAGCTLDEAFEVAFGKDAAWKGLLGGRHEYSALLLDADELKRIVRGKPKMTALTRTELKVFVHGLGMRTPQFLVDKGLLTEREEYSPDARRLVSVITIDSAQAFTTRFVTLGELLKKHGQHFKVLVRRLTTAGVTPTFDPEMADCFIYERQAAEAALDSTD